MFSSLTSAVPEGNGDSSLTQWIVWVTQLVRAPARRTGDPGLNPCPSENFSLKLTKQDLPDGYSES